jgi:hypothetical protein
VGRLQLGEGVLDGDLLLSGNLVAVFLKTSSTVSRRSLGDPSTKSSQHSVNQY